MNHFYDWLCAHPLDWLRSDRFLVTCRLHLPDIGNALLAPHLQAQLDEERKKFTMREEESCSVKFREASAAAAHKRSAKKLLRSACLTQERLQECEEEVTRLRAENDRLTEELRQQSKAAEEKEAESDMTLELDQEPDKDLVVEVSKLEEDVARVSSALEAREAENARLEEDAARAKTALETNEADNARLEEDVARAKSALEASEADNARLEEDVARAKSALEASETDNAKLDEDAARVKSALEVSEEDKVRLEEALHAERANVAKHMEDVARVSKELEERNVEMERLLDLLRDANKLATADGDTLDVDADVTSTAPCRSSSLETAKTDPLRRPAACVQEVCSRRQAAFSDNDSDDRAPLTTLDGCGTGGGSNNEDKHVHSNGDEMALESHTQVGSLPRLRDASIDRQQSESLTEPAVKPFTELSTGPSGEYTSGTPVEHVSKPEVECPRRDTRPRRKRDASPDPEQVDGSTVIAKEKPREDVERVHRLRGEGEDESIVQEICSRAASAASTDGDRHGNSPLTISSASGNCNASSIDEGTEAARDHPGSSPKQSSATNEDRGPKLPKEPAVESSTGACVEASAAPSSESTVGPADAPAMKRSQRDMRSRRKRAPLVSLPQVDRSKAPTGDKRRARDKKKNEENAAGKRARQESVVRRRFFAAAAK